jgi:Protein of unknown function (DUF664)
MTDPASPGSDSEVGALLHALRTQRSHVLDAFVGLPDDAWRTAVLPSGWTYLGVVQHLALDVERFWFRYVVAGEQVELLTGNEAWLVPTERPADQVLQLYREEAALADEIILRTPLDSAPAAWPSELFGNLPRRDLRRTILHVLTETATHAGQLDAARELVDGHQWLVLTD